MQGEQVRAGDIIRLSGGYCSLFKNSLVLYSGTHGTLERIGHFNMVFSEFPNMSTVQWAADANNPKVMVCSHPSLPNMWPPPPLDQRSARVAVSGVLR